MERFLARIRRILPQKLFRVVQPVYHRALAWLAAAWYRYPSNKLMVIGVTGTNGKTTTVELIAGILEEAGFKTASASSVMFRIHNDARKNELKMTMPGRFTLQKFLHNAVRAGCSHAVVEVTSEGIRQSRHAHITFAVAVLTNVTPEHIESHGSFEAYRAAKAELFKVSPVHIINADDTNADFFMAIPAKKRFMYSLKEFPADLKLRLPGAFNRANALAALMAARALGVPDDISKHALSRTHYIPGRMEVVQEDPFGVVVDYAHTPDALEKAYAVVSAARLVCVLGSAGGGRDTWKRPEMGRIAAEHCGHIILTNEDPYDEPPEAIIKDIEQGLLTTDGIQKKHIHYEKIIDRREAIRRACTVAKKGDVVMITGKGCESCMMGPQGERIAWDDREVVREELQKLEREKKKEKQ